MTILASAVRQVFCLLLVVTLWAAPAAAASDKVGEAESFVSQLGNQAIAKLSDESVPYEQRVDHFRELLHEGFAIDAISRFVLGRYWRVASEAEQQAFRETFLRVLTQRFLPLFEGYERDDFVIEGARPDPRNEQIILVNSRVRQPNSDNMVRAGWRVRELENGIKIVDVLAEGVSMAITLRSEYNSVIQRNGGRVSALIDLLRENVKKGAYKPENVGDAVQ